MFQKFYLFGNQTVRQSFGAVSGNFTCIKSSALCYMYMSGQVLVHKASLWHITVLMVATQLNFVLQMCKECIANCIHVHVANPHLTLVHNMTLAIHDCTLHYIIGMLML